MRKKIGYAGIAVFLFFLFAGGFWYTQTPQYMAGQGKGSATAKTALEAVGESYGGSCVEQLADLSGIPEGGDVITYLVASSSFILDKDHLENQVDADCLAAESSAAARGYAYEEYLTDLCGYTSVEAYRQERYKFHEKFLKEHLAVYEAAREKGVTVSRKEFKELIPEYAKKFGYGEDVERFQRECEKDSIANEMLYDKTIERLRVQ